MPRERALSNMYNFTKGLNTDASPLLYPPNTCRDIVNYVPDINGSISIRKALEVASDAPLLTPPTIPTQHQNKPVTHHRWRRANSYLNLTVVHIAGTLYFFREVTNGLEYYDAVELNSIRNSNTADVTLGSISMATTNGYLYITGDRITPAFIACNDLGVIANPVSITLYERDFIGESETTYSTKLRPTTIDNIKDYNLRNRGWSKKLLDQFKSERGVFPSLSDNYQQGYYSGTEGTEKWRSQDIFDIEPSFSSAPKGKVVKDVVGYGVSADNTGTFNNVITAARGTYIDDSVDMTSNVFTVQRLEVVFNTQSSHGFIANQNVILTAPCDIYTPATTLTHVHGGGTHTHSFSERIWTSWRGDPDVDPRTGLQYSDTRNPTNNKTPMTMKITTVIDANTFVAIVFFQNFIETTENNSIYGTFQSTRTEYESAFFDPYNFTNCEFFAGRIWWAGHQSARIGNKLYFSQVLDAPEKAGRCYQEADPTSREISEPVDTDGGAITINDMGNILAMKRLDNVLLVFSTNGIFAVFGRDSIFTATDYGQNKVGNQIILGRNAIVDMGGTLLVWTTTGIYTIGPNGNNGITATSITQGIIENFLKMLPVTYNERINMSFDPRDKIAYMNYDTNKVLVIDFQIGSFYKLEFANTHKVVCPYFDEFAKTADKRQKLLTIRNNKLDYYAQTGGYVEDSMPISAYLESGLTIGADAARDKQMNYFYMFMQNIPDSTATLRVKFDFSTTVDSGKWSSPEEAFLGKSSDFEVARSKKRIRGWGRAMSIRLETVGKPATILGWTLDIDSNQQD